MRRGVSQETQISVFVAEWTKLSQTSNNGGLRRIRQVTSGFVSPKASFSMGSLASSSSSSSSIRGEWENLRSNAHTWRLANKTEPNGAGRGKPLWPLAVRRGPQQHHDHQQDGGEQQAPEGVVYPQVPPSLWKRSDTETLVIRLAVHSSLCKQDTKTQTTTQHSIHPRKQTDRLAVDQLEDFGGPDDEYDGSCAHKVNNRVNFDVYKQSENQKLLNNKTKGPLQT